MDICGIRLRKTRCASLAMAELKLCCFPAFCHFNTRFKLTFERFKRGKIDVIEPWAGDKTGQDIDHHFRMRKNGPVVVVGGMAHDCFLE